jgi:uncharacterized Zn finger protein
MQSMTEDDNDQGFSHDLAFSRFARTKRAVGGIKAQVKRGTASSTWWGKRWLEVLESFNIGERLKRGRSYARKGQVLSIEVNPGEIVAKVQGSRSSPYKVVIAIAVLSPQDWQKVVAQFAGKALFSAKLLTRQMPPQIEDVFRQEKLSLFPAREADLKTSCSCPDWSNPCKHIAAVYYLLAEEFDRDPFLIFALRGLNEDQLLLALDSALRVPAAAPDLHQSAAPSTASSSTASGKGQGAKKKKQQQQELVVIKALPAVAPQADFWKLGEIPHDLTGVLRVPERNAALPKSLGNFPFWRGQEDFWSRLDSTYKESATRTLQRILDLSGENT